MAAPTGFEAGFAVTSRRFDELDVTTFHDIARLRCDVFVVEQACIYPEFDGRDIEPDTVHHWIAQDGGVATYARTLVEPDGGHRIGRVVTAPGARGRGLAAGLIGHLVDTRAGFLVLDAQSHLAGWYERFGFEVSGDEFVEDGIPHVPMRLGEPRRHRT